MIVFFTGLLRTLTVAQDTRLSVNVARIYEMLHLKEIQLNKNVSVLNVGLVDPLTKVGALLAKQLEILRQTKLLIIYKFNRNMVTNVQNGKLCCV